MTWRDLALAALGGLFGTAITCVPYSIYLRKQENR